MLDLAVALALLIVVLVAAIARPTVVSESVVAVAAAALVLVTGVVTWSEARSELSMLAPVLVFLAAVLALGAGCADEGVFVALGHWLAKGHGGGGRLLFWVFVVGALVTSVLSLDATVVLLTPVVLSAARRLEVPPRPYLYATGHVANSGSLLLPTGNLTNLLALGATGMTVVHFSGLMAIPWLAVLAVEFVVLSAYFRTDLAHPAGDAVLTAAETDEVPTPWFAFAVLALTLVGFVVTSALGVNAFWAATAGAVVLAAHGLSTGRTRWRRVVRSVDVPFLLFVMGLAVVVRAAQEHGLGDAADQLLPSNESLVALLAMAAVGAVLANLVNNLPALLILLPTAAAVGSLAVLAVLIGVNVGPNLTYPGSLATLLWRRALRDHGLVPSLRRFTVLGVLTVPACLIVGVVGLWVAGRL